MSKAEQDFEAVDSAIVAVVLPQAYQIISEFLMGEPSKDLIIRAKRLLPGKYAGSFEAAKGKP